MNTNLTINAGKLQVQLLDYNKSLTFNNKILSNPCNLPNEPKNKGKWRMRTANIILFNDVVIKINIINNYKEVSKHD